MSISLLSIKLEMIGDREEVGHRLYLKSSDSICTREMGPEPKLEGNILERKSHGMRVSLWFKSGFRG